jgi:hypothetical protein
MEILSGLPVNCDSFFDAGGRAARIKENGTY